MVRLEVNPSEVLDFWKERLDELQKSWLPMASNDENGVEIFMTAENGHPRFCADYFGETICEEDADLGIEAVYVYREFLTTFLYADDHAEDAGNAGGEVQDEFAFDDDLDEDEESPFDSEQMDRIRDITCATEDFLQVLIEEDISDYLTEDEVADVIYRVEKTLFDDYGISVWHPYITSDGDTTDFPFGFPETEDEEDGEQK